MINWNLPFYVAFLLCGVLLLIAGVGTDGISGFWAGFLGFLGGASLAMTAFFVNIRGDE